MSVLSSVSFVGDCGREGAGVVVLDGNGISIEIGVFGGDCAGVVALLVALLGAVATGNRSLVGSMSVK